MPERVAVVVPTRERPQALAACLRALRAQGIPLELIVADDAPGPSPSAAVRAAAQAAGARLVRSGGRGPAAARNAGAGASEADVVLFVDDDCEPDPGWAAALAEACPPGGVAAGETLNADPADPYAAASQALTSALQRASRSAAGTLGFAPTSNLAVSRPVLALAPFDESFPAAAGEDREWCLRLARAGIPLRHEPRAVVRHRQRLGGLRGFLRQQGRYGRGAALLHARAGASGSPLAGARTRLRLLRAGFAEGPLVGALAALGQLAVAAGYARERLSRR